MYYVETGSPENRQFLEFVTKFQVKEDLLTCMHTGPVMTVLSRYLKCPHSTSVYYVGVGI